MKAPTLPLRTLATAALGLLLGGTDLSAAPRALSPVMSAMQATTRPAAKRSTKKATKPRQGKPKRSSRRSSRRRTATAATPTRVARWTSPRGSAVLASDLGTILNSGTRSGSWGVMVVSLSRGDTLFQHNPGEMMQPASTMKLFTSAVALERLGPDHTFRTSVLRHGDVSAGVLRGNLYLKGDGDPSLSPRYFPDERPMEQLAKQVAAAGIRRVTGDIIADATAFDERLIPEGWQTRYLGASYAARVSALSLNENLVWVVVTPSGGAASVTLEPASTTLPIRSSVRLTGGRGGSISAFRSSDGAINVRGSIGRNSPPRKYSLVVDNPPLFTGGALAAALKAAGVQVDGQVRIGQAPPEAQPVATIASPPLSLLITSMNRESINIFAELLFRNAGRAAGGKEGSAETGLAGLRDFLKEKIRTDPQQVDVADGSGLSVLDRVTPRAMVQLLGYEHRMPWSGTWHASLPVAGESETLKGRMRSSPAQGNLHAKTGTTNTTASLGGYVTARDGEIIAFSFIYNGNDRWNAKATMDAMGSTLAEFERE